MFWTFFCDMFRLVMKQDSSTFVRWRGVILVMAMTAVVLVEPAYCKTNSPVLLLHQSPQEGGTLTPDVGIHHLALNTSVTLTAIPRPGYQFVCWLGDVGDPTANSTTLYLDAPKIVVAVFELAEYDLLPMEGGPKSAPAGGLLASAADYAGQGGFGGPGGRRPRTLVSCAGAGAVDGGVVGCGQLVCLCPAQNEEVAIGCLRGKRNEKKGNNLFISSVDRCVGYNGKSCDRKPGELDFHARNV
ncbi:MAG: InlB B-repeat-containing protein [Planctomycetota bacterium]